MPKRLSCKAEVATNYSCWGGAAAERVSSRLYANAAPPPAPLGRGQLRGPAAARPHGLRSGGSRRPWGGAAPTGAAGLREPRGRDATGPCPGWASPPRGAASARTGRTQGRERVAFSLSNVFSPSSSRCRAEDSRFLAHRGAVKPGRYKVVVEMNTYRRSPWDGDPVQALKNNDSKTKKKADNNTKSLDTLKRPASKSIGCSIVQLGVSLFASLYYLCI